MSNVNNLRIGIVEINWITQQVKEILFTFQIKFIIHCNDKTDIFLRFKTWLPIRPCLQGGRVTLALR